MPWRERRWFLLFLLGGLVASWWGLRELRLAAASRGWPSTHGVVLSSAVAVRRDESGLSFEDRQPSFMARVTYRYRVDGREYVADRVSFGQYGTGTPGRAQRIVQRYPPDSLVRVFYDPANPAVAVLEPGVSFGSWFPLLAGLLFTGVGAAVLLWPAGSWVAARLAARRAAHPRP